MSKLYIENGLLPEPGLYLDNPEHPELVLKSVDPIAWARKFDSTNKEYPKNDGDLADARHDPGLYLNVVKSYGDNEDDWIKQFQYSELFDEAYELAKEELDIRAKPGSNYAAPTTDEKWEKLEALRLKKQKLALKLAKQRNDESKKWRSGEVGSTKKGNPHRDPSIGTFMGGGTHKAHSGDGQEDLTSFVNTLMEKKK